MDDEIRTRFGSTVAAACSGQLSDWSDTPEGALALVLVLDQFTRHVHRDSPDAYSRDALAQATAMAAIERGDLDHWGEVTYRHFLAMPLHHAEDLALQDRHVALVEDIMRDVSPVYAVMSDSAREQTQKHRDIIARFGRFPHRNAILGRVSTPEEQEFLVSFAGVAPPAIAREILNQRQHSEGREGGQALPKSSPTL